MKVTKRTKANRKKRVQKKQDLFYPDTHITVYDEKFNKIFKNIDYDTWLMKIR